MKKFNFKSLLILVLVLVLSLSIVLVSCNKKTDTPTDDPSKQTDPVNPGPGPDPGPDPGPGPDPDPGDDALDRSEFFTHLWNLANKKVGSVEVPNDKSAALSLDLSVAFRQLLVETSEVDEEAFALSLGLRVDLVYDRGEEATFSGLKAEVYNAEDGSTFFAAYYFLDDADAVYFDLSVAKTFGLLENELVRVDFETDHDGNSAYAGSVAEFVRDHQFVLKEGEVDEDGESLEIRFTIGDIIDALVANTGSGWSLNDLLKNVLAIFNINLGEYLGIFKGAYNAATGEMHLEKVLANNLVIGLLGEEVETTVDPADPDRYIYSADLEISEILTLVNTVAGDGLPATVTKILNDLTISLSFGEKDDALDGFALKLGLEGLKSNGRYPELVVAINKLVIRPVDKTAAALRAYVGFAASEWENASVVNVNSLLNAKAEMEVELFKDGEPTAYALTAYSNIDPIYTIEGIVDMVKLLKAGNFEDASIALSEIPFELGFMSETLDEDGEKTGEKPIELSLNPANPQSMLVAHFGDKYYACDVVDILANLDKSSVYQLLSALMGGNNHELVPVDDEALDAGEDDDEPVVEEEEESGFDFNTLLKALKIVGKNVKINDKELSLDNLSTILDAFMEDGELKANWHEFLLDANFSKETCDELCRLFGATNDNEIEVSIIKEKAALHAEAFYLNDPVVDGALTQYEVKVDVRWDLERNRYRIMLQFSMWDDGAEKVAMYVADAALSYTITEAGELTLANLDLSLTRSYEGDNALPTQLFRATGELSATYNEEDHALESGSLIFTVFGGKDEQNNEQQLFAIRGTLTVTGKLFVLYKDGEWEYAAAPGVTVSTTIRESLVQFIGQLPVQEVSIKDLPLPAEAVEFLGKIGLLDPEINQAWTLGVLFKSWNINLDAPNVITMGYAKSLEQDDTIEVEDFWCGLNEEQAGENHRLVFKFKRNIETEAWTYIKCAYDFGTGDNGIGLKLDTWHFYHGGDYAGTVAPSFWADETGSSFKEGVEVNLIDSSNFDKVVIDLLAKLMSARGNKEGQGEQQEEQGQAEQGQGGQGGQGEGRVDSEGGASR